MNKKTLLIIYLIALSIGASAQVTVVNKKGTVTDIDSSKWTLSGANIFNKNTGNVGLGNPSPTYKLDVTGKTRITDSLWANTVRATVLNPGTVNDSILVADPATGIFKKIALSRLVAGIDTALMLTPYLRDADTTSMLTNYIVSANNGLTKSVKNIELGGSLTKPTTISQGTNKLVFTSTAVDGFSVDGTTFSVDGANNRIGVGTNAPNNILEVNSGVANTSGVRLSNLTSTSPVSSGTTIGVNSTGDIITMSVPATTVYTNASAATSSSTTRADVTGLSFTVTSGKNYRVRIIGSYQTTVTTTGGALGFLLTAGTAGTISGFLEGEVSVPTALTTVGVATGLRSSLRAVSTTAVVGSFLITTGVNPINTSHYIGGEFVFKCTASGTFKVQWGSEVGATAQLDAGCNMFVTEY